VLEFNCAPLRFVVGDTQTPGLRNYPIKATRESLGPNITSLLDGYGDKSHITQEALYMVDFSVTVSW
jgi:hypothetical protein